MSGDPGLSTLGLLVAGVAHELNTPLGALTSNHDVLRRALERLNVILEDEVVDEHELEELRRIVRAIMGVTRVNDLAVERMGQIVGSLRSFGRLDRSEIDTVDLHEGIESTLTVLGYEFGDRVTVVRDFGELPRVECRPHELNQVFMNLLLNASQAIDGPGTITVRTRAVDDGVELTFADTGAGIPPRIRERIFEPGFTTKGARVGMGLGLLITRRTVDAHGGTISVESEEGRGTTFTIRLPLRIPEDAPPVGRLDTDAG